MRVSFLNPADASDAFFATMVAFMHKAAHDLGIELEVVDCHRHHATLREQARALVERRSPPEYLLLVNEQSLAVEVLPAAHAAGIKTLLLNEGLMVPDRQALGSPGERYDSWLGELVPDDRAAGHALGRELIAAARRLRGDGGRLAMAGLGGAFTSSSLLRINGLRQVVAESPGVELIEIVPANWERERARAETARLLERNPDLAVIWAASDGMAMGAAEALRAGGRVPGRDVVIGGVDWAPFVFDEIRRGTVTASVGGHFLDGAWSLVLLHDHHRRPGPAIQARSRLAVATRENVDAYERLTTRSAAVDFRRFARPADGSPRDLTFSIDAIL